MSNTDDTQKEKLGNWITGLPDEQIKDIVTKSSLIVAAIDPEQIKQTLANLLEASENLKVFSERFK